MGAKNARICVLLFMLFSGILETTEAGCNQRRIRHCLDDLNGCDDLEMEQYQDCVPQVNCFSENELLLGGFRLGGDNFLVLPDGSVNTMTLTGKMYRTTNDGNWLFYSDDSLRQVTRVNLCDITDETIIAKFQGGQGVTQSLEVDPELQRLFVVEEPYEPDPIPNTVIWSMDYHGNDHKPIIQGADDIYDIAVDYTMKNLFWINRTDGNYQLEVVNYSNLDSPGASTVIPISDSPQPTSLYLDLAADRLYWITNSAEIWQMTLSTLSDVSQVVTGTSSVTPSGLAVVGGKFVYSDNRSGGYAVWVVEAGQQGHERVKYTNYDFVGAIPFGGGLYSLHKLQ